MDKFVVRQAIKDLHTNAIIGYELMIQGDVESLYNSSTDSAAANAMVAFLTENSNRIFNDKQTFMTFTPSLLFRNTPKIFDKDKVVIQIEDSIIVHPLAAIIIGKYRDEGYRFAINDFQFTPKHFSVMEYVDYIRVTIQEKMERTALASLMNLVEMAHGFQKKVIATGVNSGNTYEVAKIAGADYVEGSYIADDMITKTSKMEYLQGNLYQLIMEITKDEPDVEVLEEIVSRDASLTYALLKMANSAFFAAYNETASIHQAIVRVGINQLKQWIYLLSFKEGENASASEETLKISFMRANFASAIVKKLKKFEITPAEAYLLGMFSTLEYMIDATLEEILEELPISDKIKNALISQEGDAGKLYEMILSYEKADWAEIKKYAGELGIQTNVMAQIYMECVEEVNEIWENVIGVQEEAETPEAEAAATQEIPEGASQTEG